MRGLKKNNKFQNEGKVTVYKQWKCQHSVTASSHRRHERGGVGMRLVGLEAVAAARRQRVQLGRRHAVQAGARRQRQHAARAGAAVLHLQPGGDISFQNNNKNQ